MGDREEARALLKKSIDNLQMACDMMNTEPTYFNNLGLSQFEYENYRDFSEIADCLSQLSHNLLPNQTDY